jgi:PAS domain S-box-containing protein
MRKRQINVRSDRFRRFDLAALRLLLYVPLISVLMCLPNGPQAGAQPSQKNVLVLYSFSDRTVGGSLNSLQSSLRAHAPWQINFFVEYLESRRFGANGYENGVVETMEETYANQKLDLIIPISFPAFSFVLRHRDVLFPGVPIVFTDVDVIRLAGQKISPGVTGVTETVNIRATVDLALHLHPGTTTVAVITNASDFENYWLRAVQAEILRDHNNLKEIDLVAIPTGQLLDKVAALPPHTIILFQRAPLDSVRPAIGDFDVLSLIGQRVPTYCIFPVLCLNHGGIGGSELDAQENFSLTSQLANRVLYGERPDNIPVVHASGQKIMVDWRGLKQWHIPESALPPGTVILYRPPTLWEQYQRYVIAAIVVIAVLLLSIIGLLWERKRKRRAEAVLRESEKRFRVMADTTPSLIWMCNAQGKITYLNERRITFTGLDPDAGYGDTWIPYIHPDDVNNSLDILFQALQDHRPYSNEYRLRRSDGVYRWMFDVASPRVNGDGSFAGFIGSAIDISDQKLAQQALEKVSGQLIEAQERERSRIARDLHDDICQRLALLSMELEQAQRTSAESPATQERLQKIRQHCSEIVDDVQSLSHQLHSSRLDYLGIVAAVEGFCQEFAKQHDVGIDFKNERMPAHLPKEISLCLFRVAQEALSNAVKYSGTSHFSVELKGTAEEVQLRVRDAGAGFDVEEAKRQRGLGLVSMQERVNLVRGMFSVESKPGAGTTIIASVPLLAANRSLTDGDCEQAGSMTGIYFRPQK